MWRRNSKQLKDDDDDDDDDDDKHRARGALTPGIKQLGRGAFTHLYPLPRLRMRGAIPPLIQYVFTA